MGELPKKGAQGGGGMAITPGGKVPPIDRPVPPHLGCEPG